MKVIFDKEQALLRKAEHETKMNSKKGRFYCFVDKFVGWPMYLASSGGLILYVLLAENEKRTTGLTGLTMIGLLITALVLATCALGSLEVTTYLRVPFEVKYLNALQENSNPFQIKLNKRSPGAGAIEVFLCFENPQTKRRIGTVNVELCDDPERLEPVLDLNKGKLFVSSSETK